MVRGGGGYDTHEKHSLSTGGRGVQAWRDPEVGGNRKKINFVYVDANFLPHRDIKLFFFIC
jgi:hypothetical protein